MRDNDSGSEQQSGWQPPEYVSPWAAGSSAARADDTEETGHEQSTASHGLPAGSHAQPAEDYGQPGGSYSQPAGSYGQPGGSYSQPAGSYGQPGGGYSQPAGSYGQPGGVYSQPGGSYGQLGDSYGQPTGGGYGAWNGGYGQEPWGFGPGATPQPPRQASGLRRFLVYATVAMLAAGAGAGAAIELNHSPASSPAASSGGLPQGGNGSGNGSGSGNGNGGIFGGNPFGGSGGTGTGNGNGSGAGGTNTGSGPLNAAALAAKVDPAVVDVNSTLEYNQESAEGTGMVISPGGLILTNNHVIDQATSITVTEVTTGQTYPAKVVGYDLTDDVAVLQIQTPAGGTVSGLKTITLGNSSTVQLGAPVLAIGNAGGRGGLPSTAQGIINATDRSIQASDNGNAPENLHGLLQTNAPIQEGDSGGPLVNAAGAAIGIDTAANTSSGGSDQSGTTGFAIPINNALAIAREIINGQASTTVHLGEDGFIGINAAPSGQDCSGSSGSGSGGGGSSPSGGTSSGAFICQVFSNTPAATAGLVQGDVITAVNGTAISSANALTNYLEGKHPGDKLTVTFTDPNGNSQTTTVTLGELAR